MLNAEGLNFKSSENMKVVKEKNFLSKTRMSDALIMIIPARLIQATLNPYLTAPSIERTHYTTELVKNQEYFKAIFYSRNSRLFTQVFHLPFYHNNYSMQQSTFKRDGNEMHILFESSA